MRLITAETFGSKIFTVIVIAAAVMRFLFIGLNQTTPVGAQQVDTPTPTPTQRDYFLRHLYQSRGRLHHR